MGRSFILFIGTLLTLTGAWAASPFTNLDTYKNSLGFSRFYAQQNSGRTLKVAILSEGFAGFESEVGRSLPPSTHLVLGSSASTTHHGTQVAQMFTAMMTDDMHSSQWMPELGLYQVSNSQDLKNAIDLLLQERVDLVLATGVWAAGSNFDGTGFINEEVHRATRSGIIWVNAAGDFAKTTFNSAIQEGRDQWVLLPDQNNALMIRCEKNLQGKCVSRISLAWNDFKNDPAMGTRKDLDLALTDDMLNIIQTSTQKQTDDPNETRPGFSKLAFESIEVELLPGTYFIRVKNRSQNFTSRDQMRLVVTGNDLTMPSHSVGESLLAPADNTTVITVGAQDVDSSSSSTSLDKPDFLAPSVVLATNKTRLQGSPFASALVAAGLGLLKSQNPGLTRKDLLDLAGSGAGNWEQRGLSLNLLGFRPTGPGCFLDVILNPLPGYLREIISKGGVLVETTAAIRVMVPFDPITVAPYLRRNLLNDMIVALPQGGYAVYPRYASIPNGAAEIFQRPLEAGLCRPAPGNGGKGFRLK